MHDGRFSFISRFNLWLESDIVEELNATIVPKERENGKRGKNKEGSPHQSLHPLLQSQGGLHQSQRRARPSATLWVDQALQYRCSSGNVSVGKIVGGEKANAMSKACTILIEHAIKCAEGIRLLSWCTGQVRGCSRGAVFVFANLFCELMTSKTTIFHTHSTYLLSISRI